MTKETYLKMTESFRGNPKRQKAIILIDSILTKIAYIAYPVLLAALYLQKDTGLARAVLVPGISFVVISVFRYLYCAPRPYEVFDLPPVIPKDTRGKSFPSRHVFSIFIIGMTFFWKMPLAGVLIGANLYGRCAGAGRCAFPQRCDCRGGFGNSVRAGGVLLDSLSVVLT